MFFKDRKDTVANLTARIEMLEAKFRCLEGLHDWNMVSRYLADRTLKDGKLCRHCDKFIEMKAVEEK